jgi:hypothetical protein
MSAPTFRAIRSRIQARVALNRRGQHVSSSGHDPLWVALSLLRSDEQAMPVGGLMLSRSRREPDKPAVRAGFLPSRGTGRGSTHGVALSLLRSDEQAMPVGGLMLSRSRCELDEPAVRAGVSPTVEGEAVPRTVELIWPPPPRPSPPQMRGPGEPGADEACEPPARPMSASTFRAIRPRTMLASRLDRRAEHVSFSGHDPLWVALSPLRADAAPANPTRTRGLKR